MMIPTVTTVHVHVNFNAIVTVMANTLKIVLYFISIYMFVV